MQSRAPKFNQGVITMKAVSLKPYEWIGPDDQKLPEEEQTKFKLRTLTFEQDRWIENEIDSGCKEGDAVAHYLNMGIEDVENFRDADGVSIVAAREKEESKGGKLDSRLYPGNLMPFKDEFLSQINKIDRARLVVQIKFGRELNEAERKN